MFTYPLPQQLHDSYDGPGIPLHMGIIATLLMFIAVFLCSVSFRYFIITIAITGFLIGGKCMHIACSYHTHLLHCSHGDMDDIDSS